MGLRHLFLLFSTVLLALYPPNELNSQTSTSGALAGVVTDPGQAVVPDANVEIEDLAKGTTQSTTTDADGVYRFFFLGPGRYALTIMHASCQEEKRVVNVLLGPPVSVNVKLAIAKAKTTVNVTDEVPLVQAENGDVSATMNQTQISELPNPGNDLTYIVQTAPGVVMNTDVQGAANFSILGMPSFSYLHTMDGMDDNDNFYNLSQVWARPTTPRAMWTATPGPGEARQGWAHRPQKDDSPLRCFRPRPTA